MAVSLEEASRLRYENSRKWEEFFNNGGIMTSEVVKQMKEDNKEIAEICRQAWLAAHKNDDEE